MTPRHGVPSQTEDRDQIFLSGDRGRAMSPMERVRRLLRVHDLDAVVLRRRSNFAWVTEGGSSAVDLGSEFGVASLIVSRDGAWLATSVIEASRLAEEELHGGPFEIVSNPWSADALPKLDFLKEGRIGADVVENGWLDLCAELRHERMALSAAEFDRYRAIGPAAAAAVEEVCWQLEPGATEEEIAAEVARAARRRGVLPAVLLVGADRRLQRYRHPLPTDQRANEAVMIVLCGQKQGLYANLTRFVDFRPPDAAISRRHSTVAQIHDAAIAATIPGRPYSAVFADITAAYSRCGAAGEWTHHHQGGPTGYETRELVVTAGTATEVAVGHAVTWNPSLAAAKCEDTVLITSAGPELVTMTETWPREVPAGSRTGLALPAVLRR